MLQLYYCHNLGGEVDEFSDLYGGSFREDFHFERRWFRLGSLEGKSGKQEKFGLVQAKDKLKKVKGEDWELMVNKVELGIFQLEDMTHAVVRRECKDGVAVCGRNYFWNPFFLL